ncbi:MAG TPA: hypothetical protein PLU30_00395 [Verrucomicrobiae bacterium]|nr:hypothetical protein [Verrucomicrobiae bacterium]
MKSSKDYFGTYAPGDRPPADLLLEPLEDPPSIGRIYCQQCGMIFEFRPEHLEPLVMISNAFSKNAFNIEDFDGRKHFFIAKGCLACAENPIFIIQEI